MLLDFSQRLAAVLARHVQVEQDNIRPRCVLGSESIALHEVVEQLFAVFDEPQQLAHPRLFESVLDEHSIVGVIIRADDHGLLSVRHQCGAFLSKELQVVYRH